MAKKIVICVRGPVPTGALRAQYEQKFPDDEIDFKAIDPDSAEAFIECIHSLGGPSKVSILIPSDPLIDRLVNAGFNVDAQSPHAVWRLRFESVTPDPDKDIP